MRVVVDDDGNERIAVERSDLDSDRRAEIHEHAAEQGMTFEEAMNDLAMRGYHFIKAKEAREE